MVKLYDPPELSQEASRGAPPLDAWPGKPIGRSQLMKAAVIHVNHFVRLWASIRSRRIFGNIFW